MTSDVNDANSAQNQHETGISRKSVWMRGLYMIITAFLIGAAQSILFLLTVVQFIMMLIDPKKSNAQIAEFGEMIGKWMIVAAKFQTAKSEDKPWPLGPLT